MLKIDKYKQIAGIATTVVILVLAVIQLTKEVTYQHKTPTDDTDSKTQSNGNSLNSIQFPQLEDDADFENLGTKMFGFKIDLTRGTIDQPSMECNMINTGTNKSIGPCPQFILSMMNWEYQLSANSMENYSKRDDIYDVKLEKRQEIRIKGDRISTFAQSKEIVHHLTPYDVPSINYTFNFKMQSKDDHDFRFHCIGTPQTICNNLNTTSTREDIKFRRNVMGIRTILLNGNGKVESYKELITSPSSKIKVLSFTLSGKILTTEYWKEKWTLQDFKKSWMAFENERQSICQCQKYLMGKWDNLMTLGKIADHCLTQVKVSKDFRAFLNPPLCYGEKNLF